MKALRWVEEEPFKCFGENVVRTDSSPLQNQFWIISIIGLTRLRPRTPSGFTPREKGLLDLRVHDVEDSLETFLVRHERVLGVEFM